MISIQQRMQAALVTVTLAFFCTTATASQPTAPGDPSGTVANQQVSLQWAPSVDDNAVGGYNVYRNGVYLKTVFENRYSGELDTSQENRFYITAFDTPLDGQARAYSNRSAQILIDRIVNTEPADPTTGVPGVDTTQPSLPDGLTLISALSDSVTFSWNASTDNVGVLGYNVYRHGDYLATVFTTRYSDNTPLTDAVNIYSVVAFDEARNYTPASAALTIRVAGVLPINPGPSTPTLPPVVPDPQPEPPIEPEPPVVDRSTPTVPDGIIVLSSTQENVRIAWNAATDDVGVDGYNVYRNGRYLTTVRDTTFLDLAPVVDTPVTYAVASFDAARNFSPLSDALELGGAAPQPELPPNDGPILDDPTPQLPGPNDPVEMVPVLDPSNRFPSPNPNDPFGSLLEVDTEIPVPGGAPTTPKNLRIDLVSNDWAEFSWAPANDDVDVVAYTIYRNDGVTYTVSPDQTDPNGGSQAEIDKYWSTTSFIDCNFTRFDTLVHNCRANQPIAGETYVYQVSATDADGQESPRSAPLSIAYHQPQNAPVPIFDDFFKMPDDRFAQNNDLSDTRFFLDEFDLVFRDEFDGVSVDPTKWQTELTWQDSIIINGEQQYFVRTQADPEFGYDPFSFDGDVMTISAIPTPAQLQAKLPPVCDVQDPTGNERCQFLSGALSSHDRFGFLYGYVEGRMKVGGTPGMLSSFYLYHRYKGTGVNLHAPEIDIIEYLGENPFGAEDAFQTYHFDDVNSGLTRSAPTMSYANPTGESYSDDYHTFGVLWEPQLVIWYIDGKEVKRLTGPMVSRQPMNIVNYLVAGSAWAPTPDVSNPDIFPLEFDVDYIRVYQRDAYKGTATFGQ